MTPATIRVKAMVVLVAADGTWHVVSRMPTTVENPRGYDRLVGGGVEPGERAVDAAAREVREELGVDVTDLRLLDVVESIYTVDGRPGHEVVFVHAGRIPDDTVPPEGALFAEADGSPLPVVRRPVTPDPTLPPLYPTGAQDLLDRLTHH